MVFKVIHTPSSSAVTRSLPYWSLWVFRKAKRPVLDQNIVVQCGQGFWSGGGFGLGLSGGSSLRSESALVLRSVVEVRIINCSTLADGVPPGRPVGHQILPGFKVYVVSF